MSYTTQEPANGMYMSSADFPEFQNSFSSMMQSQPGYKQSAQHCNGNCAGCSSGCSTTETDTVMVQNITFVVTENCNLACTYCYEKHKTSNRMSKQVAKDAVDFIFNKEKVNDYWTEDKKKAIILDFIGGEPLLEIEIMDYVVEYFKFKAFELDHPWATNYMISFSSNGILFKTPKVQEFLKRNKGKVSIGITIDGNKQLHDACRIFPDGRGSYDIVEESVKEWLKTECNPQTKITLAPENIMHTFQAHKDLWDLGIRGAHANCVFEEGWTTEHARTLYSEMKKLTDYILDNKLYKRYHTSLFDESIGKESVDLDTNWCGGNGSMLAIGPDGRVYPCLRYMKYSLSTPGREEKSIGDIYNGIKVNDPWLVELQKITMRTQSPQKCLGCKISSGCAICSGYHYDKFGDANIRATYICIMHQARVLACVYHFNKLFKKLGIDKHFDLNVPKDWALEIIDEDEYTMLSLL